MTDTDVHVVTVSHNSALDLPGFVHSLGDAAPGLSLRITVVDNASEDASVAVARSLGLRCVSSVENLGYAGGINLGHRLAGGGCRAVLIANPDVRFTPRSVELLFWEAIRRAAVTVPRLVDESGRVRYSLRREPTVRRAAGEALLGDHWACRPAALSIIVRDRELYKRSCRTDWATGAVMMVPTSCDLAVGDWCEDYFLYSEETDFCSRVRATGHSIRYVPRATVFHAGGASGHGGPLVALEAVNRVRYYRLRHGRLTSAVYAGLVLVEQIVRWRDPAQRQAARAVWRVGPRGVRTGKFPDGRALYEQLSAEAQSPRGVWKSLRS